MSGEREEGRPEEPRPRERAAGADQAEDDLVTGEGVNEGAAEMVEESPEAGDAEDPA